MSRRLRYSERRSFAEAGSLGDLAHDEVPAGLRVAVMNLTESVTPEGIKDVFMQRLRDELTQHFGRDVNWSSFYATTDPDEYLDYIEIVCEISRENHFDPVDRLNRVPIPDAEERLNDLMGRHRFGYRLDKWEARKVGSPALDVEIVGPALLAVQRPGWEEAEREYRKALDHQRGGEIDDALTAANAAVEAALKAVGMKGTTLGDLAKSFRSSQIAPGYLANVPELLEDLLGKLMAARSTHGDAHGKAPGTPPAEQALADLAVYWAGAFIAYLAEIAP